MSRSPGIITVSWWTIVIFVVVSMNKASGQQCAWQYNGTNVQCNVRTLERSGLDLADAEGASKLTIQCNEVYLFESQLPVDSFARLTGLAELTIDGCKLLQLPVAAFTAMPALKRLSVRSGNSEWSPGKSLEVVTGSMDALRELQILDLSNNNLRSLPESTLCPLVSLLELNMTQNRIRSADSLGLPLRSCSGAGELQVLDVSYNELPSIPENWGASSLRRLEKLLLQFNNISQLAVDAFTGLDSLRILNVSNNHLETLPNGVFTSNKELREIHLQDNALYELPTGVFHRLEQLLVLDVSGNQLSSHNINNATFSGLIRLIILNLAHNALTRIDSQIFKELYFLQILDLRNNSIGHVEEGTFLPLYNLHTLNLAENRLHTLDNQLFNGLYVLSKLTLNNNLIGVIESNVFKNCSDLKELDLSSNQLLSVPVALQDLSMLRTLDLGENQIETFENGSFRNLHQLTGLRLIDNQIGNITTGMFWDLPRLSVLNLAKNRIQSIERGAFEKNVEIEAIRLDRNFLTDINGVFATLATLLWLNLSDNHLVWFDYAFIPSNLKWLDIHGNYIEALGNYYKLQEEIRVKTLDASHNRISEIDAMSVPNSIELLFVNNNQVNTVHANTFIDKISLARVDLYANSLSKLQMHTLRLAPVPAHKTLPEFYLGGNPFQCDCSMEWLQRINNLTSRQHPRVMDLPNIECIMPHSRGEPQRPLTTLQSKDFLCKYETHCFALCHCCDFDACDCEMTCPNNCTCYHDQTWSTNVVDCGVQQSTDLPNRIPMDATEVYLDGNHVPELQNHAFIGRKNLRSLFVNASNVQSIQNRTFAGLQSLQFLHLQDNRLSTLHGYELDSLSGLRELYLQNNLITYIANGTWSSLRSLQILRIDGNRLTTLNIWQLQQSPQFDGLRELSVGRNSWSCRCTYLQELTSFVSDMALIIQDSQDIYCVDGAIKRELDLNATAVCSDYYSEGATSFSGVLPNIYVPLVVTILGLVLVLFVLVIGIVFRAPLKVWLFSNYGVRVFGPRCEESEKLYDAVLLHSAKDAEFVFRELTVELEMGRPPLRLCVQHRDLSNEASHLHVLEAARASRRLIIVLSRNFLQTEWSRPELRRSVHEALRGRVHKLVVIEEADVLLEAESDVELVPYLRAVHVARVRHNDRHFWDKLRYAMPSEAPYRGNNYTIDHNHHQHHHHATMLKQPASPGVLFRQAPPPAYYQQDPDDTNYSSATTATPSPRPARRALSGHHHHQHQQQQGSLVAVEQPHNRPPSEHIYSSIDSDYGGIDDANAMVVGVHRPSWRVSTNPHELQQQTLLHSQSLQTQSPLQPQQQQQAQQQTHGGQNVQAYLV